MVEIGGATFLDAKHAARHMGISRTWFYKQYKPQLDYYELRGLKTRYYSIADLNVIKSSVVVTKAVA